jgi:biotin transport system substrate-specific component
MQTKTNKFRSLKNNKKQLLLVVAFVLCISLAAQVNLDFGGILPLTLQTLVIGTFYWFLDLKFRFLGILLYLTLGALGVPVFSNGAGWDYFIQIVPLMFFLGFVIAAFVKKPWNTNLSSAFMYFILIHAVILLFGIFGIASHSGSIQDVSDSLIGFIPGVVVKSMIGTGIVFFIDTKLSVQTK